MRRPITGWTYTCLWASPAGRWPWFADYSLAGRRGRWHHTLGVGAGRCSEFCLSVFARPNLDGSGWNPGLRASGTLGPRTTVSGWSGAWTARWEQTRLDEPRPMARAAPLAGAQGGHRRRPRAADRRRTRFAGASGPARRPRTGRRRVPALFPRRTPQLVGIAAGRHALVRGRRRSASWTPEGAHANPVVEAGMLFEGYLFGLYRTRSRLAVTYEGGDELWFFRISFGD